MFANGGVHFDEADFDSDGDADTELGGRKGKGTGARGGAYQKHAWRVVSEGKSEVEHEFFNASISAFTLNLVSKSCTVSNEGMTSISPTLKPSLSMPIASITCDVKTKANMSQSLISIDKCVLWGTDLFVHLSHEHAVLYVLVHVGPEFEIKQRHHLQPLEGLLHPQTQT